MSQSLDEAKIENRHRQGDRINGRCPACAEEGSDKTGNHLVIYADGKFGCVAHRGKSGQAHRKRIFALIGIRDQLPKKGVIPIEIRRPAQGLCSAGPQRLEWLLRPEAQRPPTPACFPARAPGNGEQEKTHIRADVFVGHRSNIARYYQRSGQTIIISESSGDWEKQETTLLDQGFEYLGSSSNLLTGLDGPNR